jgi:DNA replication protein DnaC
MGEAKKYSSNELCQSFHAFALSRKPNYELTQSNEPVIKALVLYFARHEESTLNPNKGIYLCGPVGTGKTTLMRLLSEWSKENKFLFVSCRDIQQEFARGGFECLLKYSKKSYRYKQGTHSPANGSIVYCFDDFGSEGRSKFYGNDVNVMEEIIQDRYNEFETYGMLTHATSNLKDGKLIQEIYGVRVRDRIRGMFNVIELTGESFRK